MYKWLLKYLKEAWKDGSQIGRGNVLSAVYLGGGAHISLYFIYKYVFGLYENIYVRNVTVALCITVAIYFKLSPRMKEKIFPFHWHAMLIMALPFTLSFNLFANNFHEAWLYWEIFMVFILAMYVPNWLIFLVDLTIGIGGAYLLFLSMDSMPVLDPQFDVLAYLIVFLFSALAGIIFVYSNRAAWLHKQKTQHKKLLSLAGSIVHEIRNPLNAINFALNSSENKNITKEQKEINRVIISSIARAEDIIDITLTNLKGKEIGPETFTYINSRNIIEQAIKNYGFKSKKEKSEITFNNDDEFIFKANESIFIFILFNLIKNALYYSDFQKDFKINIGVEKSGESNIIYVQDNGPGIPDNKIPLLFNAFYTSGKEEGTGLGLDFCKRSMLAFGGDIICESDFGKWTKFSLIFPILSPEDKKDYESKYAVQNNGDPIENKTITQKKVLIVDDQNTNLIATKHRIEKVLTNIVCDTILGGKDVITLVKNNKYDLILMDIQMPRIDGVKLAQNIRSFDKETPIIALTSLDHATLLKETHIIIGEDFNDYLNKSVPDNILYRAITKWTMDSDDKLLYLGKREDYLEILQDKRIIIADDQELNLAMTSKKLKSVGLEVLTVNNGEDLINLYKESLDVNGKSNIDIIVTDINMPKFNGDEAAEEIRKIEVSNKIRNRNKIPIIALSGDGENEDLKHFLECGMNDYCIKGKDPELMIKIIANYLRKKGENDTNLYVNNDNNQIPQKSETGKDDKIVRSKILNIEHLEHFEEKDRRDFLNLFLVDSVKILRKIKHHKRDNNMQGLAMAIHAFKGISGNIGADKLFESLRKIDIIMKEGKLPDDKNWLDDISKFHKELVHKINNTLDI